MNARIALLVVLLPMIAFSGCKKTGTGSVTRGKPTAKPTATPYLYKLGEPRPITLNADKPVVVKPATESDHVVKH